jgi:DNA-binding winged helix-turn-helix (wHTH) protein
VPATGQQDLVLGPFRLDCCSRSLSRDGVPVSVGGRALDILVALAAASGATVGKNALLDQVWPGQIVEENNLQVQISALRKTLGEGWIVTVPGRGYKLVAPLPTVAPPQIDGLAGKPSIAVLPFVNMSGDPEQEYFADGMAEEITTALSRVRSFLVCARQAGGADPEQLSLPVRGRRFTGAWTEWTNHQDGVEPPAVLPADRRQQSGVAEAAAVMQPDRRLVRRVADDRDHQPQARLFAAGDQRQQQRTSDALALAGRRDIDRILHREAVAGAHTVRTTRAVADDPASTILGHQKGKPGDHQCVSPARHLRNVRRVELEACIAMQHRMAVDRRNRRNVPGHAVADQQ